MPTATVQQTVRDLLQAIHDPQRAAAVIAAVVAHHAPELREWAQALLRARHPRVVLPLQLQTSVVKPPEAQYAAIFGVQPSIGQQPRVRAVVERTTPSGRHLRIDPELGRLAIALHCAAELRIWVVLRQYVREQGGSGWIERSHLAQVLQAEGVRYTARHLRRLLGGGEEGFWNATRQRVYMRSWSHLAAHLTRLAEKTRCGESDHNQPGVREMYVTVEGSLEGWEAQLYAAWLAYRNNPTISRSQLSLLFGRDKTVLRRWEQTRLAGVVTVRPNFAQCPNHETFFEHIPQHALQYVAWVRGRGRPYKVIRIRWQLPNSYQVGSIKQHYKKGQASKVRRRVNQAADTLPVDERRDGWHERLYFDQAATLRRFVRRHPEAEARYLWRGENRLRQGIFEINESGFPLTHPLERVRFKDEHAYWHEQAACQ